MKQKIVISIIIYFFSYFSLFAQDRTITNADMVWVGYFNYVKINSRFAVNSDFQVRTRNSQWYQYLGRTGSVYTLTNRVFVLGGFATFLYPQSNGLLKKEWRPWEEVMLTDNIGRLKIIHRFRSEQRFNQQIVNNKLSDDYTFNHRFRYKLDLQYPLFRPDKNSHAVFISIGNEIMINAGKIIKYNYFDQDRAWVGINYAISPAFTIQIQLMHIWQQQASGYNLEKDRVLRFNIHHTINASNRKNK